MYWRRLGFCSGRERGQQVSSSYGAMPRRTVFKNGDERFCSADSVRSNVRTSTLGSGVSTISRHRGAVFMIQRVYGSRECPCHTGHDRRRQRRGGGLRSHRAGQASVDWKTGAIDLPVEVIPMEDDERIRSGEKKEPASATKPRRRNGKLWAATPKRRSPSPVPPQDDPEETEAQKKERLERRRKEEQTALQERFLEGATELDDLKPGSEAFEGGGSRRSCGRYAECAGEMRAQL